VSAQFDSLNDKFYADGTVHPREKVNAIFFVRQPTIYRRSFSIGKRMSGRQTVLHHEVHVAVRATVGPALLRREIHLIAKEGDRA
jgi:hypothetical protein